MTKKKEIAKKMKRVKKADDPMTKREMEMNRYNIHQTALSLARHQDRNVKWLEDRRKREKKNCGCAYHDSEGGCTDSPF
jgi:predicted transcriptional regulator